MKVQTATIANGASQSSVIELSGDDRLVGVGIPASWTAANITLLVAGVPDAAGTLTYYPVYDKSGNEVVITAAAGLVNMIGGQIVSGCRYLKLRSGTAGTPVNQGAARTLTVYTAEA